jgi:hypothetical protein
MVIAMHTLLTSGIYEVPTKYPQTQAVKAAGRSSSESRVRENRMPGIDEGNWRWSILATTPTLYSADLNPARCFYRGETISDCPILNCAKYRRDTANRLSIAGMRVWIGNPVGAGNHAATFGGETQPLNLLLVRYSADPGMKVNSDYFP